MRSIIEDALLDLLYELPARDDADKFIVDADVIHKRKVLAIGLTHEDLPEKKDEAAMGPRTTEPEPDSDANRESA